MPTQKKNQLATTLLKFYDKPVAKVSLELFFTIVAVIIFALFAIRPTIETMGALIKELEDKRALDQRLAQKIASLSTAQGQYAAIQDQLPILDEVIPLTPRFEEAILIIEKLASDSQLTIINLQAKEVPKEPATDVPFSRKVRVTRPVILTVLGDYPSIRRLIEAISQSQRALIVDTVIFSVIEQRGTKALQATITITIPYYAEDTSLPKPPPPTSASTDDL